MRESKGSYTGKKLTYSPIAMKCWRRKKYKKWLLFSVINRCFKPMTPFKGKNPVLHFLSFFLLVDMSGETKKEIHRTTPIGNEIFCFHFCFTTFATSCDKHFLRTQSHSWHPLPLRFYALLVIRKFLWQHVMVARKDIAVLILMNTIKSWYNGWKTLPKIVTNSKKK